LQGGAFDGARLEFSCEMIERQQPRCGLTGFLYSVGEGKFADAVIEQQHRAARTMKPANIRRAAEPAWHPGFPKI
jgi:hypothetical protein